MNNRLNKRNHKKSGNFPRNFLAIGVSALLCLTALPFSVSAADASNMTVNASEQALSVLKAIEAGELDGKPIYTYYISQKEIDASAEDWNGNAAQGFQNLVQSYLDEARYTNGGEDGTAGNDGTEEIITRIVIPSGSYDLATGYLSIYDNTILDLRGDGINTPYDTSDDYNSVHIYAPAINGCVIRCGKKQGEDSVGYGYYKNMTLLGGTYHSTRQSTIASDTAASLTKTGSQIRFGHASNVRLIGLKVQDNVGAHHVEIGATNGLQISDCRFEGFSDGDLSKNERSIEAVQLDITHRWEDNFDGFGINDDLPVINAVVNNCDFHKVRRGVGSHHAVLGQYYNNIKILNNTFSDIADRCINVIYMKNATISGNQMKNVVSGIFACNMIPTQFYQPNQNNGTGNKLFTSPETLDAKTTITNNIIQLSPGTIADPQFASYKFGIRAGGYELTEADAQNKNTDIKKGLSKNAMPAGKYYLANVTISGNNISVIKSQDGSDKQNTDYGLLTWFLKNSKVNSNKIDLTAHNKNIEASAGIKANSTIDVTFDSNTVSGVTYGSNSSGIYVTDSSSNITLNKNTINQTAKNGITISKCAAGTTTVSNNIITKSGKHGVFIYQSTIKSITGNKISNSKNEGISLSDKSSVTDINSNTVTSPVEHGIGVKNSSKAANIKNNTISSSGKNGILVYNNTSATTISGNTISSAGADGVSLSTRGKVTTITANKITNPKVMGISLRTGSTATNITNHKTLSGAGGTGIYINGSTATNITGNAIANVKGTDGISFASKGGADSVSSNTITSPKVMGIALRGNSTVKTINSNAIKTPGNTGIYVNGSKITGTANLNTITGSKGDGITIAARSSLKTASKNTITKPVKNGILIFNNATATTLSNNIISGSVKADGIALAKKAKVTTISGNKISSSKAMSISLRTTSTAVTVKNNILNIAGNKAIFLADNGSRIKTLEKNTIKKAKRHGFYANIAPTYSIGNKLFGNGNNKIVATKGISLTAKTLALKVRAKKKVPVINSTSKTIIIYKTSNTKVAVISKKGIITAKKAGKAVITVKKDGVSVTCTVIVK